MNIKIWMNSLEGHFENVFSRLCCIWLWLISALCGLFLLKWEIAHPLSFVAVSHSSVNRGDGPSARRLLAACDQLCLNSCSYRFSALWNPILCNLCLVKLPSINLSFPLNDPIIPVIYKTYTLTDSRLCINTLKHTCITVYTVHKYMPLIHTCTKCTQDKLAEWTALNMQFVNDS